jgi:allantoicase
MYPDGGISRLRVFGTPTREGRMREGLRALNAMDEASYRAALANCCGSSAWVERLAATRRSRISTISSRIRSAS